jgi:hypothetical protein
MGIRSSLDGRGRSTPPVEVIDQKVGNAYKTVESVAEKLPIITYLEQNIDSLATDIKSASESAVAAEAATTASAGAADASKQAADRSAQAAKQSELAAAQSALDLDAAVSSASISAQMAGEKLAAIGDSLEVAQAAEASAKASKNAAADSQAAAALSETNAGLSAAQADADKTATTQARDAAALSESNASASAAAALDSQQAAALSEQHAGTSEGNAKSSEQVALLAAQSASDSLAQVTPLASQTVTKAGQAATSAQASADSAAAALASKNASKTSEDNSKTSETNSKQSETNSALSAQAASDSAAAALASQRAAATSEQNASDSAQAAAQSAAALSSSPTFDAITLKSGGSGGITFADGTRQTTAGGGGGGTSSSGSTAPTVSTYSVSIGNLTVGATSIVTAGFTAPFATIWRNGAKLTVNVDYTLNADGKTINFTNGYGVHGTDFFEVHTGFTYNPSTVYVPSSTLVTPVFGATGISTLTYTPGFVRLHRNGVRLVPTTDFTATDGQNINFVGFVGDGKTQYEVELLTPITYGDTVRASNPVLGGPLTFADGSRQGMAPVGMKNRIINGSGDICQRGTSFTLSGTAGTTVSGYGGADRFFALNSAGGSFTQVQGTIIYQGVARASIQHTVGTPPTDLSGGNQWAGIRQGIEGTNCWDLAQQPMTLSFIFQSNVVGQHSVAVCNSNFTYSFLTTFNYTTSGVPQKVVIPIPASPAGMSIARSTALALTVLIGFMNKGTYQGTPNSAAWQNAAAISSNTAVDWTVTAANYIAATEIQLEAGTVATPFERRPYGTELALCQRYYQQFQQGWDTPGASGNAVGSWITLLTAMRAAPTVTVPSSMEQTNVNGFAIDYVTAYTFRIRGTIGSTGGSYVSKVFAVDAEF